MCAGKRCELSLTLKQNRRRERKRKKYLEAPNSAFPPSRHYGGLCQGCALSCGASWDFRRLLRVLVSGCEGCVPSSGKRHLRANTEFVTIVFVSAEKNHHLKATGTFRTCTSPRHRHVLRGGGKLQLGSWAPVPSQAQASGVDLAVINAFHARANVVSVGFTLEGCLSLSLQRKGRSLCTADALVVHSIRTI